MILLLFYLVFGTTTACVEQFSNKTFVHDPTTDLVLANSTYKECHQYWFAHKERTGFTFKENTQTCLLHKTLFPSNEICQDCKGEVYINLPIYCTQPTPYNDSLEICYTLSELCKELYIVKDWENRLAFLTKKEEFTEENLRAYFQDAQKMCVKNMNPLINAFDNLVARIQSLSAWTSGYDINLVKKSVTDVQPFFFAIRTAPKDWNLTFEYIPDIPATEENFLGKYKRAELFGIGNSTQDSQLYIDAYLLEMEGIKLYSESPLEVDGAKMMMDSQGNSATYKFINGHVAQHGAFKATNKKDEKVFYGVAEQNRVWELSMLSPAAGNIKYFNVNDDILVEHTFHKSNMTWTP